MKKIEWPETVEYIYPTMICKGEYRNKKGNRCCASGWLWRMFDDHVARAKARAVLQEIIGQASVIAWNDSPRNSNELIAHQLNRMTDELGYVVYTDDKKG
tara:strand:- start:298 stop:597 length:300 start_codon:yes stop_codon:yes gene_type:complete